MGLYSLCRFMKLVIVESPSKCTTISKFLGSDYKVVASQGHIRDLSMKGKGGLGIDVDNGFKMDFEISPSKYKVVNQLKEEVKKADEVILATDPDREGEAISYHLAQVLGLDVEKAPRWEFHEITKPAILEAKEHARKIDMNLVKAQEARRMYDRIIGFKISNLLQKKIYSKSAGRVQSPTLKMIYDNDQIRKNFKPEEFWNLKVEILVGKEKVVLNLDKVDGKTPKITSKEEAEAILKRIPETLSLSKLEKTTKRIESKPPFNTSSMQQEAYNRFHFSTSTTQSIAQKLYEGLQINGEHVGLITYMRTDSTRISPQFVERHAKRYIETTFGPEYMGHIKVEAGKLNAQDAHEAIRPTAGLSRTPDSVAKYVSYDEAKLYRLIFDRAMASLMSAKVIETTKATFVGNGLAFTCSGNVTKFKGYSAIYGQFEDDEAKRLPALEEGKSYQVDGKNGEQKFTEPPAAYSEAKVVQLMEKEGIGRPSTYASTIDTLKKRNYVTAKKGVLTPTELGNKTTSWLVENFPEIVSSEYTSEMEKSLDKIAEGEVSLLDTMNAFYGPFMDKVAMVQKNGKKLIGEPTGAMCPKCGKPLLKRPSRFGEFIACSGYPECDYTEKIQKSEVKYVEGRVCPKCGGKLVERKGKRGSKFIGCSNYPNCDYLESMDPSKPMAPKAKQVFTEADYIKDCPQCKKGHLVERTNKKGNKFLGCTNFPKCRYIESLNEPKEDGK